MWVKKGISEEKGVQWNRKRCWRQDHSGLWSHGKVLGSTLSELGSREMTWSNLYFKRMTLGHPVKNRLVGGTWLEWGRSVRKQLQSCRREVMVIWTSVLGKKVRDYGCILKVEPKRFVEDWMLGVRERWDKDDAKAFGLSYWMDAAALLNGERSRKSKFAAQN